MTSRPIRARIRRVYVTEGLYFITAVTHNHGPIFTGEEETELLRETLRRVKEHHPFSMGAYVFLHDHLHLIIRVGESTDISRFMHSVKRNFTRNYKEHHGLSTATNLWQRGFWDHYIRNRRDFLRHLDYTHFNPVKHGYVSRPEDYPHSSYLEFVKRGWYEIGWGHIEPKSITGMEIVPSDV